nr:L,D-transpeptidase [Brevibacillus fulvus]
MKITFLLTYPEQNDLAFYRSFVRQYPNDPIGWLYLGKEWEKDGKDDLALKAYRQALHGEESEYSLEAREAYQRMLRQRKPAKRTSTAQRSSALLLLLCALSLLFPRPLGEPAKPAADSVSSLAATAAKSAVPVQAPQHVEVISVPGRASADTLRKQLQHYLQTRRPALSQPFTILLVPEITGVEPFTPLLFYAPTQVKAVLRFDPRTNAFIAQKWFPQNCNCEQDTQVKQAKQALSLEQQTLQNVLILRSALYHHYQRNGNLPQQLHNLAQAYPANALPTIPAAVQPTAGPKADSWTYQPDTFEAAHAWPSLQQVLPLPGGYPEPAVPLQPLQIVVHQANFSLSLVSGQQVVRRYPIALGKDRLTPDGYFTILQKVSQPRGPNNVYGTRGLVFSSAGHAIHGTNNPPAIGKAVSLGCIRLRNADVEELYSFVSPGTEVIITSQKSPVSNWTNASRQVLPAGKDEETPTITYKWLN